MHLCKSSSNIFKRPMPHRFLKLFCTKPTVLCILARCRTHCAWKKRCDVQKWCERGVSLPCCLQNVLCDTMAFTFSYFFNISTSKSAPNMQCGVFSFFSILTSRLNCASCHNGVHFFNSSTAKSAPTLRCF